MSLARASVAAGEAVRQAVGALGRWIRRPGVWAFAGRGWSWALANPRWALGGGAGLSALLLLVMKLAPATEHPVPMAAVQEGPFEVKIVESGTLQALRSISYSSSIPGSQAKILYLIPEGSQVQEGDLLVRFDATPFQEELQRAQAQLAQARAELVKAEQDLKLLRLRNKEELSEAADAVRLAELELASVTEGKGKVAEAESAAQLAEARRELEKAESNYEDLEPLLEEGFITKLELDRARQAVDQAEENLKLLDVKHRTYLEYTRPAEIEGARANLYKSKEAARQLDQAVTYRLSQAEAALELAESKAAELTSKVELQKQNIAGSEIHATVSGMVIYQDVFFGTDKRKVQVGDQVWPNQPLLTLPDLSEMVVETQVRETDIHKVEKNQRVEIAVDAYPELSLAGEVSFIGALARQEHEVRVGKYFQVTVLVREEDERLRPGMSARVELLVDKLDRAHFVPLEAVFEKAGRYYCYVLRNQEPELQEVLIGPSNENHVVIEAGLATGERVFLRDPHGDYRPLGGESFPGLPDVVSPSAPATPAAPATPTSLESPE